jgi:two-component sensor histidine kinase
MGGISMAFSVLIILSGFLLGAVLEIHVPIQSLAHTLSICILGAGVLSRQLFNPLRQTTESLRREIKERGRVEKSLTLSLHEKDVLLKEIHHRVKNNLQVMVSLLNLQAQKIRDKRLLGLFTESRNRIHSMALIHEQLYQSASFSDLDFETYINALVRNLCRSYVSASCPVEIEVHAKAVHLNIQKAVPCGLVLNEIVSNALKYAFPAGFRRRSRITVSMHESVDGWIHIAVKDNGAGLPKGFIPATSKSLGMELIHMITQDQLQGRVRVASRPGSGTEVRFEFPVHEKK